MDINLKLDTIFQFSYGFKKHKYIYGNYIFKEGHKADTLYFIKRGEVELLINYTQLHKERKETSQKVETINQ